MGATAARILRVAFFLAAACNFGPAQAEVGVSSSDVGWLVDGMLWSAVREPIAVRRAAPPDPRTDPLVERLKTELQQVRPQLIDIARNGETPIDRCRAVGQLSVLAGLTDDASLRRLVIGFLDDPDLDVRNNAAMGILQFEDQAAGSERDLVNLLTEHSTFQQGLLTLTRVDPRGEKSYRGIIRIIPTKDIVGPAIRIQALTRFEWGPETPERQRREVLAFLDELAASDRPGRNQARTAAAEIRRRVAPP